MSRSAVTPNRTDTQRRMERRDANRHIIGLLTDPSGPDTPVLIARLQHWVRDYYRAAYAAPTVKDKAHWARLARQYQSALDAIRFDLPLPQVVTGQSQVVSHD